jgi:putative polyhydroxyalkanoate system protein
MADIEITRQHQLSEEEAQQRMRQVAEDLGREFGISYQQSGNMLDFSRPGVNGQISLTDGEISVNASLGMLMKAMKPLLVDAINKRLDKILA